MEGDRTSESERKVDEMEQIEEDVAPRREGGEEPAPTEESAHD